MLVQNPSVADEQLEQLLPLSIDNVDSVFPGLMLGDFAVLHGSSAVKLLLTRLCVRAQLPHQLGGLKTNVLFIDGDNSFRLYQVSALAQQYELDPTRVLGKIFISRAFTAYQHVSLVLDQLEKAVDKHESKLVLLSNPSRLYQDKDVNKKEAEEIFVQLTEFLSGFAEEKQVIVVATHPPCWSKRSMFFKETLCREANVVASVRQSRHMPVFALEKHPFFKRGESEFPSVDVTLSDFWGA